MGLPLPEIRNDYDPDYVRMASPMVRYSKLPWRVLIRRYGADLAFTPMIVTESFIRSERARLGDFSTSPGVDRPLVAQFTGNRPVELGIAAKVVAEHVDGIDLNCGCPQAWAVKKKIGGYLSSHPEIVKEMVKEVREVKPDLLMSIKIRLDKDFRTTVELCQAAERAGVDWITVHGRTVRERTASDVHWDQVKQLKDMLTVPLVANGDLFHWRDCDRVHELTGVDGVMCARGVLSNPAMFLGHDFLPLSAPVEYLSLSLKMGCNDFLIDHGQLLHMFNGSLFKPDRLEFQTLHSMIGVLDYFKQKHWIR